MESDTTELRGISTMGNIEADLKNAQKKKIVIPTKQSQTTQQTTSNNG